MKKQNPLLAASFFFVAAFILSSCMKDTVKRTYTYTLFRPVYKTSAAVRADIRSNTAEEVQQPGKLFLKDHYIFLNEVDKGVHIIDNTDPAHPRNVAFIDIPGNVDIAVKGNTLYADLYTDLVAIDISDPLNAQVTKFVENVFPERYYTANFNTDSAQVISDWIVKDTTVTEEFITQSYINPVGIRYTMMEDAIGNKTALAFSSSIAPTSSFSPVSMGGSMARFTIVDNHLYTVSWSDLNVLDVSKSSEPIFSNKQSIGFNIETIYPFKDKLFIGSTNGMYIYSIANPGQPVQLSQFAHVQSCDPVIADDEYAFVTLRSGTACNGFTNQLEVLDISKLSQPTLMKTYPMTNPHGLSKDGNLLFICDGAAGLKVYDASAPNALQLIATISDLETYDVIAYNNRAIVVAKDGLYQFDYSDRNNIRQLSKITLN
jgi:hypothetical protein